MKLATVLFSILTMSGTLVAQCTFNSIAIGEDPNNRAAYSCISRRTEPFCLIRVSDLACLQTMEANHQDVPPISLQRGEVVIWVGDYDPNSANRCLDLLHCPKFTLRTFKTSPKAGMLCQDPDSHHRPFGNKFDNDKNDDFFAKPRFERLKASTVADDPTTQACYKHRIDFEKTPNSGTVGASIDPHIIIGGTGRFEILEQILDRKNEGSGEATKPGEPVKPGTPKH